MKGGFSIRTVLFALALAAIGVRAAAPPGYMFGASTSGLTVTLCGGETMHVDFGKQPAPGRPSEHAPCLFAAAAHAAPAPTHVVRAPIFNAAIQAAPALAVRVGQGLAAPPPPPTGPPQRA